MSNEWYTPGKYVDAAREVFGGTIDLDPASCALANQTVRAARYYTQEDDGLSKAWYGNVWLNPPFTGNNARRNWTRKALTECRMGHIRQAILLLPVALDTQWFQSLWDFTICFPSFRVYFYQEKARHNNPNFGVCFVYLGWNEQAFTDVFSQFGRIAKAVDVPVAKPKQLELVEIA